MLRRQVWRTDVVPVGKVRGGQVLDGVRVKSLRFRNEGANAPRANEPTANSAGRDEIAAERCRDSSAQVGFEVEKVAHVGGAKHASDQRQ